MTIFVLAGQSNMAGRAPEKNLPVNLLRSPPNVFFDHVSSFGADGPVEPQRSGGWIPLGASPKTPSTPGAHFGPEIALGHALAGRWPERRIGLIKHGRGATSLAVDWTPEAPGKMGLYHAMIEQVWRDLEQVRAKGEEAEMGAFVWAQGEADATREDWANAYESNLRLLLARVRSDLAAPRLPVILALTADGRGYSRMGYAAVVRTAQRMVAATDPRCILIRCDDFTLMDEVHYDAPSQLQLGRAVAQAYFDLERKE